MRLPLELRHHIFKYAHDNIVHQLRKNQVSDYREVESLYLLTALSELGKEYWLDQESLCQHLRIQRDDDGALSRARPLNYLAITVALLYVRNRAKYAQLRSFLTAQIDQILTAKAVYFHQDAEAVMLFLDAIACPFIDGATKLALAAKCGLDSAQLAKLSAASVNWFTSWSRFNLSKELDAKRYRDVY
jgi:hypothetical protein